MADMLVFVWQELKTSLNFVAFPGLRFCLGLTSNTSGKCESCCSFSSPLFGPFLRAEPSLHFLLIIGSDLELFVYQSILDVFRHLELFSCGPKMVFHSMSHNLATKVLNPVMPGGGAFKDCELLLEWVRESMRWQEKQGSIF